MSATAPAPTKGPEPTPSAEKLESADTAAPAPASGGDPEPESAQEGQLYHDPGATGAEHEPYPSDDAAEGEGAAQPAADDADAQPGEPAADGDADDGEGKDGELAVSSVDELIEALDLDPDHFNDLDVTLKVDGETVKKPFKDLVADHQMAAAGAKRLEEAKEKHKAATQQIAERTQAAEQQFVVAAGLVEQIEAQFTAETDSIDWQKLRDEDPGEFSAKKQEVADRRAQLDQAKANIAKKYNEAVEEQRAQLVTDHKARVAENNEKLLEALPAWSDQKTRKAETANLSSYLQAQGFSEDEVRGETDHRLIILALKAKELDDGKAKIDTASTKVVKKMKVMAPGNKAPETPKPKPTDRAGVLYPDA